jgi:serine/threonine protein kinase
MALPCHLLQEDLSKFRVRFCERLLQFGECVFGCKCQYSHDLRWRRRSPNKCNYEPVLCADCVFYQDDIKVLCEKGINCPCAHSIEEIFYHPRIYKTAKCPNNECLLYYCPFYHENDQNDKYHFNSTLELFEFVFGGDFKSMVNDKLLIDCFANIHVPLNNHISAIIPGNYTDSNFDVYISPFLRIENFPRFTNSYAEIYRGIFVYRGDRKLVLVKHVFISQASQGILMQDIDAVVKDHEILEDVSSSVVTKIIKEGSSLFVVMDRCVSSLDTPILTKGTSEVISFRVKEILKELQVYHEHGIIHGNLKPSNILVDSETKLRLSDSFGKLFNGNSWKSSDSSFEDQVKSDIYSLGVTISYACGGNLEDLPYLAKDLILRMTQKDPDDRPPITDLLEHPIFWTLDETQQFIKKLAYKTLGISKCTGNFCTLEIREEQGEWLIRAWDAFRIFSSCGSSGIAKFQKSCDSSEYHSLVPSILLGRQLLTVNLDDLLGENVDKSTPSSSIDSSHSTTVVTPGSNTWEFAVHCWL